MSQVLMREQDDDRLLTFKEALVYLRVSRATLYRMMWVQQVVGHKVGSTWRFYLSDLRASVGREPVELDLPTDGTPIVYSARWYQCSDQACACHVKYAQVHATWSATWTQNGRRVSKHIGKEKPERDEMSHFDE